MTTTDKASVEATPAPGPAPKLAIDSRRNSLSLVSAAAASILSLLGYHLFYRVRFDADTVVLVSFVFWIVYSLTFLVLTQIVFGRLDRPTFRAWISQTTPQAAPRRRLRTIERALSGSGPTLNAQWSVLAVLAVGLLLLIPDLGDSGLANGLGFAVVLSAWIVTVYAYAVHYARLDATEKTLDFPGDEDGRVFIDYLYLSAQIATTFSSSDVSVLTTRGRTVVTGQTLIAFAYTTFIIAMLITVIFLGN